MASTVEYILKMKDLISPKIRNITEQANRLDNTIGSVGKKSSMIGDFVKGTLITQGLNAVGGAITGVIEKTIDATAEYQKFQAVLATTLGSETKANEAMAMIQKVADVTNFTSTELTDNFIKLANRNVVLKSDEMMRMADVANATGKDIGQLSEAILDISNSERWKEIGIQSEKVGNKVRLTWKGVTKEVDNTEMAVKNAVIEFGGMQGVIGMTEKISNTVGGKISTLKDTWDGVFRDIGQSTSGAIMNVIDLANDLINSFRSSNVIASGFQKVLDIVKLIKLNWSGFVEVIQPILDVFSYAFDSIREIFSFAIDSLGGMQGILEKVGIIVNYIKVVFTVWKPIFIAILFIFKQIMKVIVFISTLIWKLITMIMSLINKVASLLGMKEIKIKLGNDENIQNVGKRFGLGAKEELQTVFNPNKEGTKLWYEWDKKNNAKKEEVKKIEKPESVKKLGVTGSSVGRESKIVNINIGSLVKDLQIVVSNTEKGIANMKEEVAKALLSAVNDVSSI